MTDISPWSQIQHDVPETSVPVDEWVRRMMHWHFSDATGSPFWLRKRATLGFDPVRDVRDLESLRLFGLFDKEELRNTPVTDLVPRGFAGRPFRVFETGGTTGRPCRVVDVVAGELNLAMYDAMVRARGLAPGVVLGMTPAGPHAYATFVSRLAMRWAVPACFIDLDPRWVKSRLSRGADTTEYLTHLVSQTRELLETQRPAWLFATSKLLVLLAEELDHPLAAYGVRVVCTGGTSCSPEEEWLLRERCVADITWIDTYGNTLVGHALQADELAPGEGRSYHLPPPFALMHVVDPADPWTPLPIGAVGRVRVQTLLPDLLIPNLIERDRATVAAPHPWFPFVGVRRVGIWGDGEPDGWAVEGVY